VLTVPPPAPPVHTDRISADRHPVEFGSTASAWLLGHAYGLHCDAAIPPASYTEAEAQAFEDGRSMAEFRRWVASKGTMPAPADEIADYLADRHGDDHDAQPDPFDVEVWTIAEAEYREISVGLVRDPDELIAQAERERVLGHRA
jgi:hypothetical protein